MRKALTIVSHLAAFLTAYAVCVFPAGGFPRCALQPPPPAWVPLSLVLTPATVWAVTAVLGGGRGTVRYFAWSFATLIGTPLLMLAAFFVLAVVLA